MDAITEKKQLVDETKLLLYLPDDHQLSVKIYPDNVLGRDVIHFKFDAPPRDLRRCTITVLESIASYSDLLLKEAEDMARKFGFKLGYGAPLLQELCYKKIGDCLRGTPRTLPLPKRLNKVLARRYRKNLPPWIPGGWKAIRGFNKRLTGYSKAISPYLKMYVMTIYPERIPFVFFKRPKRPGHCHGFSSLISTNVLTPEEFRILKANILQIKTVMFKMYNEHICLLPLGLRGWEPSDGALETIGL